MNSYRATAIPWSGLAPVPNGGPVALAGTGLAVSNESQAAFARATKRYGGRWATTATVMGSSKPGNGSGASNVSHARTTRADGARHLSTARGRRQ